MRMGILGGTFDPPHSAHVALARAALAGLRLDRLLIVPAGDPPHKKCRVGAVDRLFMAKAAFRDVAGAEVCDLEIGRTGPSYAVDTVRALAAQYPGAALTYILGVDAIEKLPAWAGYDALVRMCDFACVSRSGYDPPPIPMARIEADLPGISSSQVRNMIAEGRDARRLIPGPVADEIANRGFYIADRPEEALIADLGARLSPQRLVHSLGVRDAAAEIARQSGIPPGKARIAGLLHDAAKGLSTGELLALSDQAGADAWEREFPHLLHAPVGAYLARTRYGVRDSEALLAIRRHTVGGPGMGFLDMAVYAADLIEPNRADFPGLDRLRACAKKDIRQAVVACARQTCAFIEARGGRPHPATAEMISELVVREA